MPAPPPRAPEPPAPSPVTPPAPSPAPPPQPPVEAPPSTPPEPRPQPVPVPPPEPPPPGVPQPEPEHEPGPPASLLAQPEPAAPAEEPTARGGFFTRLKAGLSRSTAKLTDGLTGLFTKRKLDDAALEELEEALITADLGVAAAQRIVTAFRRTRFGKEVGDQEVREALAAEIATILEPVAKPLVLDGAKRPHVVLVVGVNGTGKTTTIAKLGQQFREQGKRVTFVAGDTFRAAAVEQLQIWGNRTGCAVVAPAKEGADAAGLAFDALKQAQAQGTEVLLVDTAGRLHNKAALMEELRKVVRVMRRLDETAPHSVLLVLDATTGQNATQQCKVFGEMVDVTGLVVTKLDGSAKGGIVVALAEEFGLPVHAVGVGEKAADLRPFSARDYARSLLGLG
nr:signal recognition particle-docking protein FtsY [Pseudoroseomonas aestuarii]